MQVIQNRTSGLPKACVAILLVLALGPFPGTARGADVTFSPLLNARSVVSLLEVEGRIFGGLDEGGLVVWDSADPSEPVRIMAGREMSGNQVTDMAWTGLHLWIATRDGGLTRIENPGGELAFRQFSSSLGGTDLTAVTGTLVGGNERVFYAMAGAGIGRIIDGLPGNVYTSEQDGLIDNDVTALQFFQGDLFIATPSGISRFANNLFTDQNAGLNSTSINDLTLDQAGNLLAAANDGVYRWDPAGESWVLTGGTGSWNIMVAGGPSGTFALGLTGGGRNVLSQYDGTSWTSVDLPYTRTYAVFSGQELWVGGRIRETGMAGQVGYGWLGRREAGGDFTTWRLDASLVRNANGVVFDSDGNPWIGSHNADGISRLGDDGWFSIYEVASAANDSSGLFNQGANVLSMTADADGIVYAGQYSSGAVRYDSAAGRSHLMFPANCGLRGGHIVNMITHPDGTVIFMHDWADPNKVEVLADPVHWRGDASWIVLPSGDDGLGNGPGVWDAVVQRNDVIWFAVEGTGLVRWDVNGDLLGPDDPLTWLDPSDDRWDDPVTDFPGTSQDPANAVALALAPDGSIWVGGNGVVRFTYDPYQHLVEVQEHFGEKASPFSEGLITGNVADLAVDAFGHLWTATRAGLNRGITREGVTTFEAWFDLGNYLSSSTYGSLYSPTSIVALPGGTYQKITADPTGHKLLLSSDRGAVLLEPGNPAVGPAEGDLATAYLYPNPFKPAQGDGLLKLGGLDADATSGRPATVEVYNLDGQVVFKSNYVSAEVGFWDGKNVSLERNNVTTGIYLVRISYEGGMAVRSLAILR